MRQHRFWVEGGPWHTGEKLTITNLDLIHQITHVLRLKPGAKFTLFNPAHQEATVTLLAVTPHHLETTIQTLTDAVPPAVRREVTLYCAVLKRNNFELVVQKATEVGVTTIIPLLTQRTIKQNLRLERLQTIAREAAEQSGRITLPTIQPPTDFTAALTATTDSSATIVCDTSGAPVASLSLSQQPVSIFIGPEGGWSPEEIMAAQAKKYTIASLGTLTLRAETAAIVASYLATQQL